MYEKQLGGLENSIQASLISHKTHNKTDQVVVAKMPLIAPWGTAEALEPIRNLENPIRCDRFLCVPSHSIC